MANITSLGFNIFSKYSGDGVREARRELSGLSDQINKTNMSFRLAGSGIGTLTVALMSATVAGTTMGAAIIPTLAGVVAATGTAGAAMGIYGGVVKATVTRVMELRKEGAALNADQMSYIQTLDSLKDRWNALLTANEPQTLSVVNVVLEGIRNSIDFLQPLMDKLHPIAMDVAEAFREWASSTDGAGRAVNALVAAGPQVYAITQIVRNMLSVLGSGFRAAMEHSYGLMEAVENMTITWRAWADSGGFERFFEKMSTYGPAAKDMWNAIVGVLVKLRDIFVELGPSIFSTTILFLKLVAALPTDLIEAFVVAMIGMKIISFIAALVGILSTAFNVLRTAMLLIMGNPLVALFVILAGVIIYLATKTQFFQIVWAAVWGFVQMIAEKVWGFLTDFFSTTWNSLKAIWEAVWNGVKNFFVTIWDAIAGFFSSMWNGFTSTVSAAWNGIVSIWNTVWDAVKGVFVAIWDAIAGYFTTAWNTFVSVVTSAWNVVKEIWEGVWNAVSAVFSKVWEALSYWFMRHWNNVWTPIKEEWELWKQVWNTVWSAIKDFFVTIWTAVSDFAKKMWSVITDVFNTALNWIKGVWETVWGAVSSYFSTLWSLLVAIVTDRWEWIKRIFQVSLDWVTSTWTTVWTNIQEFFQNMFMVLSTFISARWDWIKGVFQGFVDWVLTTFWSPLQKFFTETLPGAFSKAVDWIKATWDKVMEVVKAPIKWIVDVVYNNGIVKMWNAVAGLFSADKLEWVYMATGGAVRGEGTGTSDSIPARLSNGEHVWTAREVRAAGGHEAVARMRSQVLGGDSVRTGGVFAGYAEGGGVFGWVGDAVSQAANAIRGGVTAAVEPPLNALKIAGHSMVNAIVPGSDNGLEKAGRGIVSKPIDTVLNWIKGNDVVVSYGVDMPWPMMWSTVKKQFPDATMTSGYRPGDPGYHGKGRAIDVAWPMTVGGKGRMLELNKWLATTYPMSTELIHTPGINLKNGKPTNYGSETQAAHWDHVHWAMAGNGGGSGSPGNVQSWRDLVVQELTHFGQSAALADTVLRRMNQESGGNARAINNWDSNAKAGTPSKGLMQVIDPTFAAFKNTRMHPDDIWDPGANIHASMNYAMSRYGSLENAYNRAGGYALGTKGALKGVHMVAENGPEMITRGPTPAFFRGGEKVWTAEDMTATVREGGDGDVHVTINAPYATRESMEYARDELVPELIMILKQDKKR